MSMLIKGMEMPKEGYKVIYVHSNGSVYQPSNAENIWHKIASAVSVPTPHGRLVDTDKLEVHDGWLSETEGYSTHITFVYSNAIDLAPTIIEAEEG